ncbi:hypothetical protein LTR28_005347, partial [Elasticomyces elasticus]
MSAPFLISKYDSNPLFPPSSHLYPPVQPSATPELTYHVSRALDPVFAVFIGVSAAAMRINREEKERGKNTEQTVESVKRRWALLIG